MEAKGPHAFCGRIIQTLNRSIRPGGCERAGFELALSRPENSSCVQGQTKAGADAAFSTVRQRKKGPADEAPWSQWGGGGAQALVSAGLAGGARGEGPPPELPASQPCWERADWEQNSRGRPADGFCCPRILGQPSGRQGPPVLMGRSGLGAPGQPIPTGGLTGASRDHPGSHGH